MSRCRRYCPAGYPVHVIQRGNNRQVCFSSDRDMAAYANWLKEASEHYGLAIHAWVFMTNHVHLLATPSTDTAVSRSMQYLGRYYVRYFNANYRRTGTLFEGRFKSCLVQSERYLLACARYIELNPVRAGLVSDPAEYIWSSYRSNALGQGAKLWSPHTAYLGLGRSPGERRESYRNLFAGQLDDPLIADIRQAASTGFALGNEQFRLEVEQLTGRPQKLLKRGPKKSDTSME